MNPTPIILLGALIAGGLLLLSKNEEDEDTLPPTLPPPRPTAPVPPGLPPTPGIPPIGIPPITPTIPTTPQSLDQRIAQAKNSTDLVFILQVAVECEAAGRGDDAADLRAHAMAVAGMTDAMFSPAGIGRTSAQLLFSTPQPQLGGLPMSQAPVAAQVGFLVNTATLLRQQFGLPV